MKKLVIGLAALMAVGVLPAQAAETPMYVNDVYVVRELGRVGDFDMLPILDIAGELGYQCTYDGTTIRLWKARQSFTFTMGSADVYDQNGVWFGLDVVPQVMNGRVMVPANFFIYNLGTSYTWDGKTSTLFLNSDSTYHWLVSTPEYQQGLTAENDTRNSLEKLYDTNPTSLQLSDDKKTLTYSDSHCLNWTDNFKIRHNYIGTRWEGAYSESERWEAVAHLEEINSQLGLPAALADMMLEETDTIQTHDAANVKVSWTYSAKKGLTAIYELK